MNKNEYISSYFSVSNFVSWYNNMLCIFSWNEYIDIVYCMNFLCWLRLHNIYAAIVFIV